MTTATATHVSADLTITFAATMERVDYGVPGSPVWWEPLSESVEITDLEIAGVEVEVSDLPKYLVDALYTLSDGLEWENDCD